MNFVTKSASQAPLANDVDDDFVDESGVSRVASLEFLNDVPSTPTKNVNPSNTNHAPNTTQMSWTKWLFLSLFRMPTSALSMSYCIPVSEATSPFEQIKAKSPYDNFNGSFPYVATILGAPKVGKTLLCKQIKSSQTDIHNRNLFKFSSMPPDIQISVSDSDEKGVEKSFEMGLYDTIGFRNPELVQYLLEGQAKEDSNAEKARESVAAVQGTTTKAKKKVNSEAFLVVYDMSSTQSLEMGIKLIRSIYNYFGYDPSEDTENPPVVIYLIANKADLFPDKEATTRPPTEKLMRAFLSSSIGKHVVFYEVSALKNEKVVQVFRELSQKISKQREEYYQSLLKQKRPGFWD